MAGGAEKVFNNNRQRRSRGAFGILSRSTLTLHRRSLLEGFKSNCELLYRVPVGFVALQIEHAVDDWIHTAVGAGEQVQAFLQQDVDFVGFLRVQEKPARDIRLVESFSSVHR